MRRTLAARSGINTRTAHDASGLIHKQAVVGMRSRNQRQVRAQVVGPVSAVTLQQFVKASAISRSTVYSNQNPGYLGLKRLGYKHQSVNHSVKEYVNGQAHTNGIESFCSLLKRGYVGTHHWMSPQHLGRYVTEFAGRYNIRQVDTIRQMATMSKMMDGKQLPYKKLVPPLLAG